MMFFILYIALEMPWELAFPDDASDAMGNFTLVVFIFDILVNFRTTFYNDEFEEIVDWKKVALNYSQSWIFLIDILSTFPFELL